MNWGNTKTIALMVIGLFVLTGTYNAIVINSESHLAQSKTKFVKRLDESYGVTVAGREVAAAVTWQKLSAPKIVAQESALIAAPTVKTESTLNEDTSSNIPEAAVQEQLNLSLVEVMNPAKWKDGLKTEQFYGTLTTNSGVIEDLNVTLPDGQGVAVSFTEMTGNVFEYDLNGEVFSGMMYQVDQNAYMVNLTNGPLEGTRLRFSSQAPAEQQYEAQQYLAENNVEVGSFGSEEIAPDTMLQTDQQMQEEAMQAQTFNFDQSQAM
jgi:hypothetical protein